MKPFVCSFCVIRDDATYVVNSVETTAQPPYKVYNDVDLIEQMYTRDLRRMPWLPSATVYLTTYVERQFLPGVEITVGDPRIGSSPDAPDAVRVASGTFDEMWPVFLAYARML